MTKIQKKDLILGISAYVVAYLSYAILITFINHYELLTIHNFTHYLYVELQDFLFLFIFFVIYEIVKYGYLKFME